MHTFSHITLLVSLTAPATPHMYPLSLHDALPISRRGRARHRDPPGGSRGAPPAGPVLPAGALDRSRRLLRRQARSEEHTSEPQSPVHLVCRLLLEKKKNNSQKSPQHMSSDTDALF